MAGQFVNHLFELNDAHKDLHRGVAASKPEGTFDNVFAVAVLEHGKTISGENFLWFKVKPKHSVAKLKAAYNSRTSANVIFRFAGHLVPDTIQMRQLDHLSDSLVVFTAHEEGTTATSLTSPSSSTPSQARTPLQPVNAQLHIHNAPASPKPDSKSESLWSPSGPNPTIAGSYAAATVAHTAAHTAHVVAHVIAPISAHPSQTPEITGLGYSNSAPIKREPTSGAPNVNSIRHGSGELRGMPSRPHPARDSFAGDPFGEVIAPDTTPKMEHPSMPHSVKPKDDMRDSQMLAVNDPATSPELASGPQVTRLQKVIAEGSPEQLEAEVRGNKSLLDSLRIKLEKAADQQDTKYFLQQIEMLRNEKVDSPTIIGVVGNTGAGKSSVINAMLEEERLVPTNCMRACTAVVTEMSWNSNDDEDARYRSDIEFIQASDWEKDLRVSMTELLDPNGQVSRECSNADSEAGIAYAKIKAVYPHKTREMIASSTVEQLMSEPDVKALLGTTKKIQKARPEPFYRELQHYVDSKEKATDQSKKKDKGEKKSMEFWPLIKVVRIYTKADALSTGAVVVDLPGVHDSNAARAAVAAGYMKQCTGLWIVAPINRAVDDKAAKSLLGESFKRQLKYDGIYSRITFICSKTDDISITEASNSLNLDEQVSADWAKIDEIDYKMRAIRHSLAELKESKAVYSDLLNDADDKIEIWDGLKDDLEDGNEVWAPFMKKKRRRPLDSRESRKKPRLSKSDDNNSGEEERDLEASESESGTEHESDTESQKGDPLTLEAIEEKLSQFKDDKKRARKERSALDAKSKALNEENKDLQKSKDKIETAISAICIKGRNNYSKGAIQTDFAAGIKELDQENAQEEDEASFNPEEDIRDYEEVARSLPVFCCSARAYQKLSGRLLRDSAVPGFAAIEETEIPQLQQHCKHLTEGVRASNCRRFLTNCSQLMNSLKLWAGNDGTGLAISSTQRATETRFLKSKLQTLERDLDNAVRDCLRDMNEALVENIFENFGDVIQQAAAQALPTAQKWGAPVNRDNREVGGFYWSTYKALCRRNGIFANANGAHDLNLQLCEPIIKQLANHWERAFARRLPGVLQSFSRKSKNLLAGFHREVEARCMKQGAGFAGIAMLGQQLRIYEAIFANLTAQMIEVINTHQRDANREFTPVIASKLASAYEWCAAEVGGGQFLRMKSHMTTHVDANLNMFAESCDEVKTRLTNMCDEVAHSMADKADEVFVSMSRDYTEVISGTRVEGQILQKWERQMKAEIARCIEESESGGGEADETEEQKSIDAEAPDASETSDSEKAEQPGVANSDV